MKGLFVLVMSLLVSQNVFANCEDGDAIAEAAVIKKLEKADPKIKGQCKALSQQIIVKNNGEVHLVSVYCKGPGSGVTHVEPPIFSVTLREVEDAVCFAIPKSIKMK